MILQPINEIDRIRVRLAAARRAAHALQPFSPAWDAAMAGVEDLERQAWHIRIALDASLRGNGPA